VLATSLPAQSATQKSSAASWLSTGANRQHQTIFFSSDSPDRLRQINTKLEALEHHQLKTQRILLDIKRLSGWQMRTRSNWTWWFESYKSSKGANMGNPERRLRPIIRCSNEGEDARRISIGSLEMGRDALRWRESCHPLIFAQRQSNYRKQGTTWW